MSENYSFLLRCARWRPGLSLPEAEAPILRSADDCDRLVHSAARHCLAPQLCRYLLEILPVDTPESVLQRLRKHLLDQGLFNRLLAEKLFDLLDAFESEHIPAIPLKGPVLAILLHGTVSLRQFEDLDIVIHHRDRERARSVMISHGYMDVSDLSDRADGTFVGWTSRHDAYVSGDGSARVELHHEIGYGSITGDFSSEIFWQDCALTPVEDRTLLLPTRENLLLYLCIHGALHMWSRIGWICDVDRFLRIHQDMDWVAMSARARRLGCATMLSVGLLLTHHLLGSPVPDEIAREARQRRELRRLVAEVVRRLSSRDPHPYVEKCKRGLFYLRIMDRRRDKKRYISGLLESPNVDESILHLPVRQSFAHFTIRSAQFMIRASRVFSGRGVDDTDGES